MEVSEDDLDGFAGVADDVGAGAGGVDAGDMVCICELPAASVRVTRRSYHPSGLAYTLEVKMENVAEKQSAKFGGVTNCKYLWGTHDVACAMPIALWSLILP